MARRIDVLQGFFAKTWCNVWCFCGQFVVLCMVEMVFSSQLFNAEKHANFWNFILWVI